MPVLQNLKEYLSALGKPLSFQFAWVLVHFACQTTIGPFLHCPLLPSLVTTLMIALQAVLQESQIKNNYLNGKGDSMQT